VRTINNVNNVNNEYETGTSAVNNAVNNAMDKVLKVYVVYDVYGLYQNISQAPQGVPLRKQSKQTAIEPQQQYAVEIRPPPVLKSAD